MVSGRCASTVFCVHDSDLNVLVEYVTNDFVHFTLWVKLKKNLISIFNNI
jgi:hypothetical protein